MMMQGRREGASPAAATIAAPRRPLPVAPRRCCPLTPFAMQGVGPVDLPIVVALLTDLDFAIARTKPANFCGGNRTYKRQHRREA